MKYIIMSQSNEMCNVLNLTDGDHLVIEQKNNGIHYKSHKLTNKFQDNIEEMRSQNILSDVTLVAHGTKIRAHKLVLAAASLFFYSMFSGLVGQPGDSIVLDSIHRFSLPVIVNYIYTGEILISEENVKHLLRTSKIFSVDAVFKACCHFLQEQLNIYNYIHIASLVREYKCQELLDKIDVFIIEHFGEIIKNDEFLELQPQRFYKIIKSNDLKISNEIEVFKAVLAWVKHDVETRQRYLSSLMEHVRFPLMSQRELTENVEAEPLIQANAMCRSYLREAKKYYYLKDNRKSSLSTSRTKPRQLPSVAIATYRYPRKNVLLVAGYNQTGLLMEKYHFDEQGWLQGSELFSDFRRIRPFILNAGQQIYIIGGYSSPREDSTKVNMFDLRQGRWQQCNDLLENRTSSAAAIFDGDVYVTGGCGDGYRLKSGEKLDKKTKYWKPIESMLVKRSHHSMCPMDGMIYAVGGMDKETLSEVEVYSPATNTWTSIPNMSIAKYKTGLAAIDGKLYSIGGWNTKMHWLKCVEVFDTAAQQWQKLADMKAAIAYPSAIVMNGLIYVVGVSEGVETALDFVQVYNPRKNKWTILPNKTINATKQYVSAAVTQWPF